MSQDPGPVASIVDCHPGGPGSNPGRSERSPFFTSLSKKAGNLKFYDWKEK